MTETNLPTPEETVAAAAQTTGDHHDSPTVNLLVPVLSDNSRFDPSPIERTEEGYEGSGADDLGRLAAAVAATQEDTSLHYPELDASAVGPWLVIEPLAGRLSTVHAGTGIVRVALAPPADRGIKKELAEIRNRLNNVLVAAQSTHKHYPIDEDEQATFTTGMTTFSLAGVTVEEDQITVAFDVSTTPATTTQTIKKRFKSCESVIRIAYEPQVGVERAAPPAKIQEAAETAAEAVIGDWEYEWFPKPTAFSRIPNGAKLALGASEPETDSYSAEAHSNTVRLLRETLASFGGES